MSGAMDNNNQIKMSIVKAQNRKKPRLDYILFGRISNIGVRQWFERKFLSKEAAEKYANKHNWLIIMEM